MCNRIGYLQTTGRIRPAAFVMVAIVIAMQVRVVRESHET